MRYLAMATDYDGTLAHNGAVDDPTYAALERLKKTGRALIMVTGRELDELQQVFPRLDIFDRVVAENGALIYRPATREEHAIAARPPRKFIDELTKRGVGPISVGRVIVATWEPHETTVLQTIRDMGLEYQVIFNKGAVMILPSGVTKATGLAVACEELGLSAHNVVGIGDAENDHAFLSACQCGVAVANSIEALKKRADWVTEGDHGRGVQELIDRIVEKDLADLDRRLSRHHIVLGTRDDETEVRMPAYGATCLIAGSSGSGKSTLATGFLDRLAAAGYQFCVIDPEGDHGTLEGAASIGTPERAPTLDEILDVLKPTHHNVVANLVGVPLADRPAYFLQLLNRLEDLRTRVGRPHWIIIDEAHHVLPVVREHATVALPKQLAGMLFITVEPAAVAAGILQAIDILITTSPEPAKTVAEFAAAAGAKPPAEVPERLEPGEAVVWRKRYGDPPFKMRVLPGKTERRRHRRKYAEGNVGPEFSFYFRGPEKKLNLQAENLHVFCRLAAGIDDETWRHHLTQADYSRWFREVIKDDLLADEAAKIEAQGDALSPIESRRRICELIDQHYTLPTQAASGATDLSGR